jgi:chlorite dismutase
MRFDEVTARYGEFGPFHLGVRVKPADLAGLLLG